MKDYILAPNEIVESPNCRAFRKGEGPKVIVIHYTAGRSAEKTAALFAERRSKVSAHFIVGRDASLIQCVPMTKAAYHAGKSEWDIDGVTYTGLNGHSIGIEMDNAGVLVRKGDRVETWFGEEVDPKHYAEYAGKLWHRYTMFQMLALMDLLNKIDAHLGVKLPLVGHSDIAPKRKIDPGPAFPWEYVHDHR